MWKEKMTYGLTLVYNNATTIPSTESDVAKKTGIGTHNNYFKADGKTPGCSLPGAYDKGSVNRTGYTFTGYWYGAEQIIDQYGRIKATPSRFTENATVYAGWSVKVFKITLDNQGADKRSGTAAIYERYADGFFLEKECKNRIGAITTPQMTGYSFYGYYINHH